MNTNKMEQLAFFPECGHTKGLPTEVLEYLPNVFDHEMGTQLMERFMAETPWTQKMYPPYELHI